MTIRLVIPLAIAAFLAVGVLPAQAAFMTGKTLHDLCSSRDADNIFSCENYIAGVVDYHVLVRSLGTAPSVDFCLPASIRMQQLRDIVQSYLSRRSEQQGFVAAPAVTLALYNAYPCARGKKK